MLDESVGEIGRFYFDRGVWAFGRHVTNRLDEAGQNRNQAIAQAQRAREWERLMGVDMTNSATGFADPSADSLSAHGRAVGDDCSDDDLILLD